MVQGWIYRPLILLRILGGEMLPERMYADTLIIDSEALTLSMTYRYWLRFDLAVIPYLECVRSNPI
ncbi:hypothetical protein ACR72M_10340 [Xenorhabdus bovienii]